MFFCYELSISRDCFICKIVCALDNFMMEFVIILCVFVGKHFKTDHGPSIALTLNAVICLVEIGTIIETEKQVLGRAFLSGPWVLRDRYRAEFWKI